LDSWARIKAFLTKERESVTSRVVALIHDDAPKNNFSILSGRLRMIEDMEAEMASIERDRESQG